MQSTEQFSPNACCVNSLKENFVKRMSISSLFREISVKTSFKIIARNLELIETFTSEMSNPSGMCHHHLVNNELIGLLAIRQIHQWRIKSVENFIAGSERDISFYQLIKMNLLNQNKRFVKNCFHLQNVDAQAFLKC